ncbi:MAG: hypothetical protein FIA93_07405 [Deltaproteobacteria bacterium]|nr:hypothetical protein [Deltaproteobacteria bacterium]
MAPSLPCPNCGHVDDLETVIPLGIIAGNSTLWNCRCGILRAVEIGRAPRELVRKVIVADETRDWIRRSLGHRKAG